MMPAAPSFADRLLAWHAEHGRHDLPWQHPRTPYRVWVSEIMLQQTQVTTVLPYFTRFMTAFDSVQVLAEAPLDDVIRHWAGLGYYARARNLHRTAHIVHRDHGGIFPDSLEGLMDLPGIGRSTAGAILSQAYGKPAAILDGNVRRLLARHAGVEGWPGAPRVQTRLWQEAEDRLPTTRLPDYTQAVMDLGNAVCRARQPLCPQCPVSGDCVARQQRRVHELPGRKPARSRPHRQAYALLLEREDGALWLETRAPSGLWGGLNCPPLSAMDQSAADFLQDHALAPEEIGTLPTMRHAFTHFDLNLIPLRARAGTAVAREVRDTASGGVWIKLADPDGWPGMPTPIRRLIESLRAASTEPSLFPEALLTCPAPSSASSSAAKLPALHDRPTPASSASASTKASRRKPGKAGSSTRRA